jgi:hypothetical protein
MLGDTSAFLRQQTAFAGSRWFRQLLRHDPAAALQRVRAPVLAINGSKDVQVPARENLASIEAALRRGGNRDVTVRELPGLNHLLQTATTGSPLEYGRIEETIAPHALEQVGEWMARQARTRRR